MINEKRFHVQSKTMVCYQLCVAEWCWDHVEMREANQRQAGTNQGLMDSR